MAVETARKAAVGGDDDIQGFDACQSLCHASNFELPGPDNRRSAPDAAQHFTPFADGIGAGLASALQTAPDLSCDAATIFMAEVIFLRRS
jgi:hypothetical protein